MEKDKLAKRIEETIWKLNPEGHFDKTVTMIEAVESNKRKDKDGNLVTVEYIIAKYNDYFEKWEANWGESPMQFIPKDQKLLSIYNWCMDKKYLEDFEILRKGNPFYLFGNSSRQELQKSLDAFKQRHTPEHAAEGHPIRPY